MSQVAGATPDRPWRVVRGGLLLQVRLTPKASRDEIEGLRQLSDGSVVLAARVRAAPDKGAANAALLELVARALETPKSSVGLHAGATARLKTLELEGDATVLAARLEARFAGQS